MVHGSEDKLHINKKGNNILHGYRLKFPKLMALYAWEVLEGKIRDLHRKNQ